VQIKQEVEEPTSRSLLALPKDQETRVHDAERERLACAKGRPEACRAFGGERPTRVPGNIYRVPEFRRWNALHSEKRWTKPAS
jgi:hypothetical protein